MDKMRWRYGDTNPVVAAVDKDTVIEIGDLLWQDIDDAKPASWLVSQHQFKADFLGVAMQRSIKGCTAPIRVATTGVFEFDCNEAEFELGNLIGAAFDTDRLVNQWVEEVSHKHQAIARVAKRGIGTSVYVAIQSTVMGPV